MLFLRLIIRFNDKYILNVFKDSNSINKPLFKQLFLKYSLIQLVKYRKILNKFKFQLYRRWKILWYKNKKTPLLWCFYYFYSSWFFPLESFILILTIHIDRAELISVVVRLIKMITWVY